MNIRIIEYNTADACLGQLKQALGHGIPLRLEQTRERGRDCALHIGTKPHLRLIVETKKRVTTRNQALYLTLQVRKLAAKAEAILFADWIPEPAAEEFRKAGVFFVDAQGNAFIRKPPYLVMDIRGKKPARPPKAEPGRLIEPGGLKIVHYLLTHPRAAGNPLRAIAEAAGVALGTAHAVMKELQRGQWLLPGPDEGRRFGDLKGLVELFVWGYGLKLRPACLTGRFRHQKRAPQEILDAFAERLKDMDGRWAVTGGMAARELTHYLEPDAVTLFVDDQAAARLGEEPMLRDDAGGNVTLLRFFGAAVLADQLRGPWPLATPLLVYADLLETGGAREVETAQMICEQFLEPEIARG